MWQERTAEETAQWHTLAEKSAHQEAMGHALMLFVMLLAVVFLGMWGTGLGVIVTPRQMLPAPWVNAGGTVVGAVIALAVATFAGVRQYRSVRERELLKLRRQALCTACGTVTFDGGGRPCPCGAGPIRLLSELKWVEPA